MGLLASYIRLLIMSPNIKMSQRGNNYVCDKLNGFAKLICVHIYIYMYYIWVYFHVLFYFNSKLKLQVIKINKSASFMIS